MTVPVPDQLEYISDADGVTKDFPYPKRFLQKDEIVVLLRGADGVDTPQILNTHYTIAGSSWPSGGTISFITAPQAPNKVVRYRMTQAKQTVDLENNQRNDAPSVETQLDRLTMAIQDRGALTETAWLGLLAEIIARKAGDKLLNERVDQEIIDRINGDNALSSLISQAGSIAEHVFESNLAASFAQVKETFSAILTLGRDAPFDGDGGLYVNTDTGSDDTFVSGDGRTWYLAPDISDKRIFSPSLIANRRDDICYITDYYSAAGGSVIGGNADRFTDAWNAAYADNEGKGTTVHIPKSPNGQDWLLNPIVLGDPLMNSQGKVSFKGTGRWTVIKPSGPMTNLIHQAASMNSIENIMIDDTSDSHIGGAAIRVTKAAMDGLPQYFTNIFGLGCERLFHNDVADEGYYHNIETLNCRRPFDFNSGGVGAIIDRIKLQGFEIGIVLNSDTGTDPARIHSEGLTLTRYEILGGSVWPNAIGVLAIDSLLFRMGFGVVGQMGASGKGLWLKGDIGNSYGRFAQCWFDVGANGWGIEMEGVNNGHQFFGCDVSYGGEGVADGSINGWHIDGATDFLIFGGRTADPTGAKFNNAALITNSSGVIRDVTWNSGAIGQSNSALYWDSDYVPPAAGREATSSYIRNGWTPYTPTVSASTGTITTSSAAGEYKRVGKTVTVRATATITTNGTGAGYVSISLPIAAASGAKVWQGSGREDGVSGNMLQTRVAGGTNIMIVNTYNNNYPGANNAVIQVELTYEC